MTTFINQNSELIPSLVKIDIEGAESLAMEGALEIIEKYKPIILLEIHSIYNAVQSLNILYNLNYQVYLLKKEDDGRCFVSATPK